MNLSLYCNSFNGKNPLQTQFNQKTLMCGSYYLPQEVQNKCIEQGYILDNSGKNISSMNKLLGDLTGLYWIWKNTDDEFVGTNQYRRFYDEAQIKECFPLNENTLFVSQFLVCQFNVWEQYITSHGDIGINILKEAARHKRISITKPMIDSLYTAKLISPCNMFFAHRNIFDSVCKVLFEIIFELYNGCKYTLNFIQDNLHSKRGLNEKRLLAFLSERILNILYLNSNYFFGNIKVQPINYATVDKISTHLQ